MLTVPSFICVKSKVRKSVFLLKSFNTLPAEDIPCGYIYITVISNAWQAINKNGVFNVLPLKHVYCISYLASEFMTTYYTRKASCKYKPS